MKHLLGACLFVLALSPGAFAQEKKEPSGATIRLNGDKGVEVVGLSKEALAALAELKPGSEEWAKILAVYVDRPEKDRKGQPSLLGTHRLDKGTLRFESRFPLAKGVKYRVVLNAPAVKPKTMEVVLLIPRPERKSVASVTQVYPTGTQMPENLLRFYIYFNVVMGQGDSYRFIRLLGPDGREVDTPFLELDQELWTPDGLRLTVFFDPGRIKRGLLPRKEAGPALEEGKSYTLVIDRAWTDGEGAPMRESWRRTFKVGPPDDTPPHEKTWKLTPPAAESKTALKVLFPKPMDHALLGRLVWVEDAAGKRVAGKGAVEKGETSWTFSPTGAWNKGAYRLVADMRLEDVCGNNIRQPFEIDVFKPIQRKDKVETVKVAFEVK